MTALLETRATVVAQYHAPRRAARVTAYLVHTAESVLDLLGPDTGAEGVAEFICHRTDAGSYHDLADSDSIVEVVPPQWEAFHCRHGVNRWAMGLSFACRTTDWARMTPERRTAFLVNGAKVAVRRIRWIEAQASRPADAGPFPIRRITKAQAEAGLEGFVGHGDMDPGHRSDPGAEFPWAQFLALAGEEYDRTNTGGDDEMAKTWNLTDLGVTMESVGALYEAAFHRSIAPGADWRAYDVATYVAGGRRDWYQEVVKTLKAGTDPAKLLEFVEWALANPAAAAKL